MCSAVRRTCSPFCFDFLVTYAPLKHTTSGPKAAWTAETIFGFSIIEANDGAVQNASIMSCRLSSREYSLISRRMVWTSAGENACGTTRNPFWEMKERWADGDIVFQSQSYTL